MTHLTEFRRIYLRIEALLGICWPFFVILIGSEPFKLVGLFACTATPSLRLHSESCDFISFGLGFMLCAAASEDYYRILNGDPWPAGSPTVACLLSLRDGWLLSLCCVILI